MEYVLRAWNMNFVLFYVIRRIIINFIIIIIFQYWKSVWSFVHINLYCAGAGLSTLMSISDELVRYFFRPKMEKTQPMREEMKGKAFISRQSWDLFSLYLIW